jgi:hypothetical protein
MMTAPEFLQTHELHLVMLAGWALAFGLLSAVRQLRQLLTRRSAQRIGARGAGRMLRPAWTSSRQASTTDTTVSAAMSRKANR